MGRYDEKKISEMMRTLESGVTNMFSSEEYKRYLGTMAKFYSYSANNCIMIVMQKPDATLVAGYVDWKKNFRRNVKAGEKGIRIFAPAPYKVKKIEEVENPDGTKEEVEKEVRVEAYRPVYVYDISQTEGKELPKICHELKGGVEEFEKVKEAIEDIAACPITFEEIRSGAKGYYSLAENRIVIKKDMPEVQTIKTMVHELAHSVMHCDTEVNKQLGRNEKEVQAESVAYIVSSYLGLDTSEYSFGYIGSWSKGKEITELKESAKIIKNTSRDVIDSLAAKLELVELPVLENKTEFKMVM